MNHLILGTRGSDLALAQTRIVAEKLNMVHPALEIEIQTIKTTGDKRLDISLSTPGPLSKGLFTKELEEALLSRQIDAAVHSLKDLPIDQPAGLCLGAILERADPSDVLVSKYPGGLLGLPVDAIVATSSLRRKHQLLRLRSDLRIIDIRGNVPTRLQKLAEDDNLDGLLLAKAGLDRLGFHVIPRGLQVFIMEEILPAPGQGAIAVECRIDNSDALKFLKAIHHEDTARCVYAERELLRLHGGGCHLPLGALAVIEKGTVKMRSFLAEPI